MTNYNDYNSDDYTCSDNNTVTFDGVDINNNRTCSDNGRAYDTTNTIYPACYWNYCGQRGT